MLMGGVVLLLSIRRGAAEESMLATGDAATYAVAGASWLFCAALATPTNRGRVIVWLGRLGSSAWDEQSSAAAIASLLGGQAVLDTWQTATKEFRVLRFSQLRQSDLASSDDAADLRARTEPAELGNADAFVSHSWHDDGGLKWRVLKAWATDFEKLHGREPTLWLDKACIDQSNIDQSLACLPIFLSGCNTLLVVPGTTYCQRLWCCIELFVFCHIGSSVEQITVLPLCAGSTETDRKAEAKAVLQSLLTFNAKVAKCFKPEDRQRLLAVIEMSFGTANLFNNQVASRGNHAGEVGIWY